MKGREDADIVREESPSDSGEEGGGHNLQRVGENVGNKDGGFVQNIGGVLWFKMNRGEDKAYRDPIHPLRHQYDECCPTCPE